MCRFIQLSFSFGGIPMKFLTCNPEPPQQYFHDDPPEIWVTWYNNALITCHLAKATAAAAGAAWYSLSLMDITV